MVAAVLSLINSSTFDISQHLAERYLPDFRCGVPGYAGGASPDFGFSGVLNVTFFGTGVVGSIESLESRTVSGVFGLEQLDSELMVMMEWSSSSSELV